MPHRDIEIWTSTDHEGIQRSICLFRLPSRAKLFRKEWNWTIYREDGKGDRWPAGKDSRGKEIFKHYAYYRSSNGLKNRDLAWAEAMEKIISNGAIKAMPHQWKRIEQKEEEFRIKEIENIMQELDQL